MEEDNCVKWNSLQENKKEKVPCRRRQRGREFLKKERPLGRKSLLTSLFSLCYLGHSGDGFLGSDVSESVPPAGRLRECTAQFSQKMRQNAAAGI